MKKIAISLGIIGVVAAIVIGATTAYFSDTETSKGNTVTAGTVDLQVSTNGEDYYDDPNVPVIVSAELKPSEWIYKNVWLKNVGMNGGVKDIHFKNIEDDGGALSEPECEAEGGTWVDEECEGNEPIDDLSTQIEVDVNGYCFDQDEDGEPDTLAELQSRNFKLGELVVEEIEKDVLSFHIKSTAENEYQGDITKFDVEFSLIQLNAPNELEDPIWISCRPE